MSRLCSLIWCGEEGDEMALGKELVPVLQRMERRRGLGQRQSP